MTSLARTFCLCLMVIILSPISTLFAADDDVLVITPEVDVWSTSWKGDSDYGYGDSPESLITTIGVRLRYSQFSFFAESLERERFVFTDTLYEKTFQRTSFSIAWHYPEIFAVSLGYRRQRSNLTVMPNHYSTSSNPKETLFLSGPFASLEMTLPIGEDGVVVNGLVDVGYQFLERQYPDAESSSYLTDDIHSGIRGTLRWELNLGYRTRGITFLTGWEEDHISSVTDLSGIHCKIRYAIRWDD